MYKTLNMYFEKKRFSFLFYPKDRDITCHISFFDFKNIPEENDDDDGGADGDRRERKRRRRKR